jgi:LysM repeat protein
MTSKAWLPIVAIGIAAAVSLSNGRHSNPAPTVATPVYVAPAPAPSPPPVPALSSYIVASGDNLYGIAAAHGVTLGALLQANAFANSSVVIQPGQSLIIPRPSSDAPLTTVSASAEPARATLPAVVASPQPAPGGSPN